MKELRRLGFNGCRRPGKTRGGMPKNGYIAGLLCGNPLESRFFISPFYFPTSFFMKRILNFLVSLSLLGGFAASAQTPVATVPAAAANKMSTSSSKMTTRISQTPATKVTIKSGTMGNQAGMTKSSTMTKGAATMTKSSTMTTPSGMTKTSTSTKMKADGTPDMRYSENKSTKTTTMTTGARKADGTPDMRYKTNKTTKVMTKSKM